MTDEEKAAKAAKDAAEKEAAEKAKAEKEAAEKTAVEKEAAEKEAAEKKRKRRKPTVVVLEESDDDDDDDEVSDEIRDMDSRVRSLEEARAKRARRSTGELLAWLVVIAAVLVAVAFSRRLKRVPFLRSVTDVHGPGGPGREQDRGPVDDGTSF